MTAPTHAAAGEAPRAPSRRSIPTPAEIQCTIGKSRMAVGKGTRASSGLIGYSEPVFGLGRMGRPPERSSFHTGSRARDQASWVAFSIGNP